MIANYHTHTPRCNHAVGSEREYAEKALEAGLQILGFSDHSPYIFPGDYYSRFRMRPEQLQGYVDAVLALKEEYKGRLEIHLGLELEYYPGYLPDLLPILRDSPVEYALLGQHFVSNELDGIDSGWATEEGPLKTYCHSVMEAMETGLFTYFAHPDLMNYVGDRKIYRHYMRQVCRTAKSCGIPLEINLLGIAEGKHYPNRRFWEIAAEEGCPVILGRDVHNPKAFLEKETEGAALKLVEELGLDLLETVQLRPIK